MRYRTLDNEVFDLNSLPADQKKAYKEAKIYLKNEPLWPAFGNFWTTKVQQMGLSADSQLYRIFQDMDSRLGIRQGLTRLPNWREELGSLIDMRFKSRYEFCKLVKLDEGQLSRVLNGKEGLSVKNLARILDKIGFRIVFTEKDIPPLGEE
jgi:hypothetical protein